MPIPRPCLTCGDPTTNGTRCIDCEQEKQRKRNARRDHYKGDYKRLAAAVRANAITCHLCGEGARPDDPWQADHLTPGDPNSPLAAAHRTCNASKGNRTTT